MSKTTAISSNVIEITVDFLPILISFFLYFCSIICLVKAIKKNIINGITAIVTPKFIASTLVCWSKNIIYVLGFMMILYRVKPVTNDNTEKLIRFKTKNKYLVFSFAKKANNPKSSVMKDMNHPKYTNISNENLYLNIISYALVGSLINHL